MSTDYHTTIDLADRLGPILKMGIEKYATTVDEWDGWELKGDTFTYFAGMGDTSTWMAEVASAAYRDMGTDRTKLAMFDALWDMAYRLQSGPVWCVTVKRAIA